MRIHPYAFALAVVACARPNAAPPASGGPPRDMQLVVLAGQSNMAGRGAVDAAGRTPHPRVWMLDSTLHWIPAVDPVHFDKPVAGVGPGRAFAEALAERDPEATIGLVPTAVGGSAIASWAPGGYDAATRTHPYDDALRRVRAALPAGHVVAILWHQGESDGNAENAPRYEARLRAVVGRFRADVAAPDAPFLIGEIGHFPERPWTPWRAMVDSAQRVVAAQTPHAAYVSAEGLGHRGDTLHFSTAAARELGRRYAGAYFGMRR
jgi:hypothetical protein